MNLQEEIATYFEARGERLLSLDQLGGGASQELWHLRVSHGAGERDLVVRRDAGGALSRAARTRREEHTLMKIAHAAGLPVPQVLGEPLTLGGREAFFMEYVAGETIGRRLLRDAAFAVARSQLPTQAMQALVKIHRVDGRVLDWLPQPKTALDLVACLEQDLDALSEGRPALELGLRWLRLNAPPLERTTLVHGDFRIGNLVVGPEGLRSVLDWELSHLGDPAEDLGWFCVRAWRYGCDHFPAGGITTREELLRLYRAAGDHEVCPERLRYWELFGNVKWGIVALSQAARYVRGETSNFELAVVGRLSCESEWETLRLLSEFER